jgi:hypothetical protein
LVHVSLLKLPLRNEKVCIKVGVPLISRPAVNTFVGRKLKCMFAASGKFEGIQHACTNIAGTPKCLWFFLPEVCRVLWGYLFSILFAEKLKEILKLKTFVKTLKKGKVMSGHAKLLSFCKFKFRIGTKNHN